MLKPTRRGFIFGGAAAGALVVGWWLSPRRYPPSLTALEGEQVFNGWIKIGTDGIITIAMPQLEMGQGISTLLPQIIAQELGADWRQIAVESVHNSGAFANAVLAAKWSRMWMPIIPAAADDPNGILASKFAQSRRFSATADGTSLAAYEMPCREAGASARAMLAQEAAERWGISWEECEVENGLVRHGDKFFSFPELVEGAASQPLISPPPLRTTPPGDFTAISEASDTTEYPRLDLPAKIDGTYQFAGDIRLPGMLFAAVAHPPFCAEAKFAGFKHTVHETETTRIIARDDFVAATGSTWWQAHMALAKAAPKFSVTDHVETPAIEAALNRALDDDDLDEIYVSETFDRDRVQYDLTSRYEVMPAVHATLETSSVAARYVDGRLELWLATQAPEQARLAAAKALDIAVTDVILYPMPAGGSFDRRLEHVHAIQAAIIARECERPINLMWSRRQEQLAGLPRAPIAAKLRAVIKTSSEQIEAVMTQIAAPNTTLEFAARLFDNRSYQDAIAQSRGKTDHGAADGAYGLYAIPESRVLFSPADINLPTARMRGNAHGPTAFFNECFLDEICHRFGQEPLSYRVNMLTDDPHMVACLQRVARISTWGGGDNQKGQGLACHRMALGTRKGRIACVAQAEVAGSQIRVSELFAAVNIGRIVNRDIAYQQIEGGLIFGMGLAFGMATSYTGGMADVTRLSGLNVPRLQDCPAITIAFIPSDEEPFDPGELGAVVAPPAIANAVFAATGHRHYRMPFVSGT